MAAKFAVRIGVQRTVQLVVVRRLGRLGKAPQLSAQKLWVGTHWSTSWTTENRGKFSFQSTHTHRVTFRSIFILGFSSLFAISYTQFVDRSMLRAIFNNRCNSSTGCIHLAASLPATLLPVACRGARCKVAEKSRGAIFKFLWRQELR